MEALSGGEIREANQLHGNPLHLSDSRSVMFILLLFDYCIWLPSVVATG